MTDMRFRFKSRIMAKSRLLIYHFQTKPGTWIEVLVLYTSKS
jgi:hypothetical protein